MDSNHQTRLRKPWLYQFAYRPIKQAMAVTCNTQLYCCHNNELVPSSLSGSTGEPLEEQAGLEPAALRLLAVALPTELLFHLESAPCGLRADRMALPVCSGPPTQKKGMGMTGMPHPVMAETGGFEPPHQGVKVPCLAPLGYVSVWRGRCSAPLVGHPGIEPRTLRL